jgi:mitochondrial fission protein ELM1
MVLRVIVCCKSIYSSVSRSLSTVKPLFSLSLGSCQLCKLSRYSLFIEDCYKQEVARVPLLPYENHEVSFAR